MRSFRGTSHGFALGLALLTVLYVAVLFGPMWSGRRDELREIAMIGGHAGMAVFCGGWIGWRRTRSIDDSMARVFVVTAVTTLLAVLLSLVGFAVLVDGIVVLLIVEPSFYLTLVLPVALITAVWAAVSLHWERSAAAVAG
jgi:hypothetical protein